MSNTFHTMCALAFFAPVAAHANGYQDLHQSADGMATAYATNGTGGDDISAAFSNPASLARFGGMNLVNGTTLIMPRDTFTDLSATSWGLPVTGTPNVSEQFLDTSIGNNFYFSSQLTDRLTFGLLINAPWATVSQYPDTAVSRYVAVDTNLLALTVSPTLAWRLSPNWSVGASLNMQYYMAKFSTMIDDGPSSDGNIKSTVTGNDFAVGATFGIEGAFGPTRLGFSYRSKIEHDFEGDIEMVGGDVSALSSLLPGFSGAIARNGGADFKIATPWIATLGVAHQLNDQVELYGSAMRVGWSAFEDTVVTYDNGLPETVVKNGWKDKTYLALGAGYRVNEKLMVRAGIAYDPTPTPDEVRNPRAPNADRIYTGLGASYVFDSGFELSASWAHTFFDTAPIGLDLGNGNTLNGDINVDADIIMLQINKSW